jgi:hypothetical protein
MSGIKALQNGLKKGRSQAAAYGRRDLAQALKRARKASRSGAASVMGSSKRSVRSDLRQSSKGVSGGKRTARRVAGVGRQLKGTSRGGRNYRRDRRGRFA